MEGPKTDCAILFEQNDAADSIKSGGAGQLIRGDLLSLATTFSIKPAISLSPFPYHHIYPFATSSSTSQVPHSFWTYLTLSTFVCSTSRFQYDFTTIRFNHCINILKLLSYLPSLGLPSWALQRLALLLRLHLLRWQSTQFQSRAMVSHDHSVIIDHQTLTCLTAFMMNGERFYIKGLDYQPGGSSNAQDPIADSQTCLRDLEYFKQLGINTLRVRYRQSGNDWS